MKRLFDIVSASMLLLILSPLFLGVALAVRLTSPGPVFFKTNRVGRRNELFQMYKFRTMKTDTPQIATHLLGDSGQYLTAIGGFLRRTSLDELPQLINVIRSDMSLVGPRPALFNQEDLIALRTEKGVHVLVPGITGWAQVNGRDELSIPVKVEFDRHYLHHHCFTFDIKILLLTAKKAFIGEGVSH